MNRVRLDRALLLAALGLSIVGSTVWAGGCTEAELEPIPSEPVLRDDKLQVSGRVCTREPENLVFPLRVLFVVDSSTSMAANDPPDPITGETGRERAIRETWEPLLSGADVRGIRFGIIRFSSQAQTRTPVDVDNDGLTDSYYTADPTQLDTATAALGETDRTTNYINALGEAYFEMRTELVGADLESLPLSKYVVVFLSDGAPDTDNTDERDNSRENILDSVRAMVDLAKDFRVGDFSFHTAYLSSGQQAFDQTSKDLLQDMAEVGGGNFRSFPSGEELNFLFVDFTVLKRAFTLRSFGAVNMNTILDKQQLPIPSARPGAALDAGGPITLPDMNGDMGDVGGDVGPVSASQALSIDPMLYVDSNSNELVECGEPLVDTDGDGLSDRIEFQIETNPFIDDTDDDGLSDTMEWQLRDDGLDPLNPDDSGCLNPSPCVDEDSDGFCDCVVDVDVDGVCDCVDDPDEPCADAMGHDCVDEDMDGWCDCPDVDMDGRCDWEDQDGDGLRDCEEVFLGTAQNGVDTDADGIPDWVEVRFQTNPGEDDAEEDRDSDRTLNEIEIMANTDPLCEDVETRSRMAYRYTLEQQELEGASTCYDFHISNMTLVPTLENPAGRYPGNGWNRILLFAGEVAFDDPDAFASYRVACLMAAYNPEGNYKLPPSGRMSLAESDFVEVADFDPEEHCKWP